jgi:pimeloyl-ACP methyl ester carboxylesterase
MVLPGFTAGDESTIALRFYLRSLGYYVHGWRLGPNLGFQASTETRMAQRLEELAQFHGRKLSLVGWSLGGIMAREIARVLPETIRQVITLGSPFAGNGHGSNVRHLYELITGQKIPDHDAEPPPVPSTAIFSRTDGVTHWRTCREREAAHTDNIEIRGSHCGLGFNPVVFFAIADRLAQPDAHWQPFGRDGWRRMFYK